MCIRDRLSAIANSRRLVLYRRTNANPRSQSEAAKEQNNPNGEGIVEESKIKRGDMGT